MKPRKVRENRRIDIPDRRPALYALVVLAVSTALWVTTL